MALMALVFGRTHSAVWGSAALLAVIGTYGLAAPFAGHARRPLRPPHRHDLLRRRRRRGQPRARVRARPDGADRARRARGDRAVAVPLGVDRRPSRTSCRPTSSCGRTPCARALSNVGFMLGPIAGGVLVATVGGSYAFAFNAVALAASAALAWSVVGSFNEKTGEKLRGGLGAGFRVPLERPRAALDHGRLGPDPGRRRRAARVRVPARRAVRRGLARLRPPDQLVGRRHAARLGVRRARRRAAPRTGRSSWARSASRSCSAASRSRRSSGSCA